ncbi:vitamin K epoxide reductase family protein [Tenacibaculum sp. 190524A02b]|uniref:vitamin K epoxide reductase family protein n=1 Tax=Tenacibaculum vairaonense TaxID=3137860 RepID=UPI0031FB5AFD
MEKSLTYLVELLLKKNKISYDKKELNFQIQSHPSYPSLHAITGVLTHFNIENIAADVPVNTETLQQLPNCFLAQIITDQGKDLAIIEKKNSLYFVSNSTTQNKEYKEKDFLKVFTGIIVAVEENKDNTNSTNQSNFIKPITIFSIVVLTSFLLFKSFPQLTTVLHLILSITGVIISVAILKQELGLKTTIGNAFCSGTDDKKDCDAVLSSKGAEITKNYKLSDLSVLYFSLLSVTTFILIKNPSIPYWVSLLVIPITLYSIYYQYFVVKKWCLLCLSIVGIMWVQAIIPFINQPLNINFYLNDILIFGIISMTIWLAWQYIKPLVSEITELRKEKIESIKFKRNFELFKSLFEKSPQLYTQLKDSKEIIFGNPNANLELLIVTNPFCGHCKPVHNHIDEILQRYHDNVKIKIRFNINPEDTNSELVKITSRLLEIYNEEGSEKCLQAMNSIYGGEKPSNWLKIWGESTPKDIYLEELTKEQNWCKENAINFTPEILVNGKSFPKEYNRTDLMFFIEDLEEIYQEQIETM